MKLLTIGADPELFLQHSVSGMYVSAHDLVPGTKTEPVQVPGGAVQVDGTAAEFNIKPAEDATEFVENIKTVIDQLTQIVRAKNPNLVLVSAPTATYDRSYFDSLPDNVKELGCDPDYDAWLDGAQNPRPDASKTFRTGGGHIHLGWRDANIEQDEAHAHDCIKMTKQLDAALYIPSMLWDQDVTRRILYGRRGAFRPKNYGVEYRSLSNAWLKDPAICEWVFQAAHRAWELIEDGCELFSLKKGAISELINREAPSDEEINSYVNELTEWDFPPLPAM